MNPDVNLISFNGPQDNGRSVDMSKETLNGVGFSDTVKCSGLSDFVGRFGTVISGSEDACDVNNLCRAIDLTAAKWVLNGTMGITIKGGSTNVRISGTVEGRGRETDVDIGNYSDQSHEPVIGTRLNLWRVDGGAVRVRVLNGDLPFEEAGSGPYQYVFPGKSKLVRSVVNAGFKILRQWGFFR